MCSKKNQFSSYSDLSSPLRIEIGDGRALKGVGVGDCTRGVEETVEHLVLECSKYEHEKESLMNVVHEQYGENKWNARCVGEDSGMRYLVRLDEECNMTVVDAVKDFLVHPWNKRQGC
ncbi:hypothetical protein FHG87_023049 [Trinorchestia longiramus]|nr:hypothetical protein FHG87_023049 [Trinorchestia longiramus]